MSYTPGTWYNELYRIFSNNVLLTVDQTAKLGSCLKGLEAGENIEYLLNDLYFSIRDNADVEPALDEYIHAYIEHRKEVEEDAKSEQGRGWFAD